MGKDKDFRMFSAVGIKDQIITIAMAAAAINKDRPQDNRDAAAERLGISRRSLNRELARRRREDW